MIVRSLLFLLGPLILFFLDSCKTKELAIGDIPPEFERMEWIQSPVLNLKELKNKVVLLRWWTDECQFCVNTADALNDWHQKFADSGLVIIGLYHPKPEPKTVLPEDLRSFVLEKEFQFPIALDDHWINLQNFWLHSGQKPFTSVSFLIGREGRILFIHPGGEYHSFFQEGHEQCVQDYYEIDNKIREAIRSN